MSQEKVKIDDLGFSEEELFSIQSHSDEEAERITAPRYSYWKSVFRVFFRKKINIFVLVVLVLVVNRFLLPNRREPQFRRNLQELFRLQSTYWAVIRRSLPPGPSGGTLEHVLRAGANGRSHPVRCRQPGGNSGAGRSGVTAGSPDLPSPGAGFRLSGHASPG